MASTLYSGFKTQGRSQPKEEWQALAKKWQRFESDFKRKVQFFGTGFDAAFAVTVVGHITAAYIDKSDESLEPRRQELRGRVHRQKRRKPRTTASRNVRRTLPTPSPSCVFVRKAVRIRRGVVHISCPCLLSQMTIAFGTAHAVPKYIVNFESFAKSTRAFGRSVLWLPGRG